MTNAPKECPTANACNRFIKEVPNADYEGRFLIISEVRGAADTVDPRKIKACHRTNGRACVYDSNNPSRNYLCLSLSKSFEIIAAEINYRSVDSRFYREK